MALARRLNRVLDDDIAVRRVSAAPAGFDARFAAIWRRYVYRLADGDVRPGSAAAVPGRGRPAGPRRRPAQRGGGDAAGAARLRRRSAGGARARRRSGPCWTCGPSGCASGPLAGLVECTVRADAFCHSMVRSLVGALVGGRVGSPGPRLAAVGRLGHDARLDRAGARAGGLTLEEVGYPADHELAGRAHQARAVRELASEPPEPLLQRAAGRPERRRQISVSVWGHQLELTTAAGVFAADGLDRGTAVLLRETAGAHGQPAGAGPGLRLRDRSPSRSPSRCPGARVDAVDVNERALSLCRDNAVGAGRR